MGSRCLGVEKGVRVWSGCFGCGGGVAAIFGSPHQCPRPLLGAQVVAARAPAAQEQGGRKGKGRKRGEEGREREGREEEESGRDRATRSFSAQACRRVGVGVCCAMSQLRRIPTPVGRLYAANLDAARGPLPTEVMLVINLTKRDTPGPVTRRR